MPSAMSPAPRMSTRRPSREPSRSDAISTAAWDTDAVPRAMPVSVRARLPVSTAWRKSRFRTGPATSSARAASQALRTCPSTSASPSTAESRPDATENRWPMASRS